MDTDTVSYPIRVRIQGYIIFFKAYVGHNRYWISDTILVRVSGMIQVRVRGLKWSIRATYLRHVSHLFPISPLIRFFLLFFFLILSLLFFQPFPSLFGSSSPHYSTSYRYNSLNSSSPFLTLHLPIFFSISPYYYSSSNSSPPFFGSSSGPIIPHISITIPPTIHLPSFLFFFFFFFFLFFFSINLLLLSLHLSLSLPLPFSPCFAYQKI
jgi:hypothetical protein